MKASHQRGKNDYWTFKPDAEISDAWRSQEIERQQAEAQQKQQEEERRQEEEYQALVSRLKDAFAAIERGEIDNGKIEVSHQLKFEYDGKWYYLSEGQQ